MLPYSHFNSAARAINSTASFCNTKICSFHGVDDETIPHFPTNYAQLKELSGGFNPAPRRQ